jgi:hypothetical protein
MGRMEIHDTERNQALRHVGLGLTEAEARELRDTLDTLLADPGERQEHVASIDFQSEVTIWLKRT